MKRWLLALLGAYQRWVSPAFPRRCRYEPTCSRYAAEAIAELGPVRGTILAAWRVLRCNPFSNGGIDDVADRALFRPAGRDLSIPSASVATPHPRRAKPEEMRAGVRP